MSWLSPGAVSCCVLWLLPCTFLSCALTVPRDQEEFQTSQTSQITKLPLSVLFKISPLLLFLSSSLHTHSVFHTSQSSSFPPAAARAPLLPSSHSGVSGSPLYLSCLHLIPGELSSPVLSVLQWQLSLLLFPHLPAFGFSLLLFTQQGAIRKGLFLASLSVAQEQSQPQAAAEQHLGPCPAGSLSWERQARECGAGHLL